MEPRVGLEPTTSDVPGRRSASLSFRGLVMPYDVEPGVGFEPTTSPLREGRSGQAELPRHGADDGTRTRNSLLGRQVLYQSSSIRKRERAATTPPRDGSAWAVAS